MIRERIVKQPTELDRIAELEEGLQIEEHALDEAIQEGPDLFYEVSKEYALTISRRDAMKQTIDELKAEADIEIRREGRDNGDKVTEKEIEARIRAHKPVVKAYSEYLRLSELAGQLGALKEAYQQRSYALKELSNLWVAGYFGNTDEIQSKPRQSVGRDRQAEVNRRAMSDERRRRG
jgi:hypothetical protein